MGIRWPADDMEQDFVCDWWRITSQLASNSAEVSDLRNWSKNLIVSRSRQHRCSNNEKKQHIVFVLDVICGCMPAVSVVYLQWFLSSSSSEQMPRLKTLYLSRPPGNTRAWQWHSHNRHICYSALIFFFSSFCAHRSLLPSSVSLHSFHSSPLPQDKCSPVTVGCTDIYQRGSCGFTYLKLINVELKDTTELSVVQRCLVWWSAAGVGGWGCCWAKDMIGSEDAEESWAAQPPSAENRGLVLIYHLKLL